MRTIEKNARIEAYLERKGKKIGVICSFDRNENEYDHEFFLCDSGEADQTAWEIEIRKMENVTTWEATVEEAINLGLGGEQDFYNYEK